MSQSKYKQLNQSTILYYSCFHATNSKRQATVKDRNGLWQATNESTELESGSRSIAFLKTQMIRFPYQCYSYIDRLAQSSRVSSWMLLLLRRCAYQHLHRYL
ncbi:Hypothetical_protein [Hexamita inflata]|uniref:Hypothetical_protein n=1 Tax=Hexamita inflata TaxID=28002 RepID=A0ABP1HBH8_9EUKA